MFEARTEGTKRRGRPRIEWEKYIRDCKREGEKFARIEKTIKEYK